MPRRPPATPRIVFLGAGGALSVRPLEALLGAGHRPVAVLTAARARGEATSPIQWLLPRAEAGLPLLRGSGPPGLAATAWSAGLSFGAVERLSSAAALEALRGLEPDVLCVSCFPEILSEAALAVASWGCFNVHPSALPELRGPAPLFWCFHEGRELAGVSIHRMVRRVDAGPVVAQAVWPLPDGTTGAELEEQCALRGGELLVQVLRSLTQGSLSERAQAGGSYRGFPGPDDYVVDARQPARRVFNFIRGVGQPSRPVVIQVETGRIEAAEALGFDPRAEQAEAVRSEAGRLAIRCSPGVLYVPESAAALEAGIAPAAASKARSTASGVHP